MPAKVGQLTTCALNLWYCRHRAKFRPTWLRDRAAEHHRSPPASDACVSDLGTCIATSWLAHQLPRRNSLAAFAALRSLPLRCHQLPVHSPRVLSLLREQL